MLETGMGHQKAFQKISVDPIREPKCIEAILGLLKDKPRDLLLFTLGINNGLRTCDLLRLKVGQLRNLKPGDTIKIKESKTGKTNVLAVNKKSHRALQQYLNQVEPGDDDWLFPSQKGGHPLQTQRVRAIIKQLTGAIELKGNFGAHTLRKTFGYMQRTVYRVSFEVLCKRYNHSSPAVTMRYLGIEDKEVNEILMNEI
jgi:integrase